LTGSLEDKREIIRSFHLWEPVNFGASAVDLTSGGKSILMVD
jgi:hypothetical protein